MVHVVRYISAAALVSVTAAVPMKIRDSAINEAPVSAPNGILLSDAPTDTNSVASTATPMAGGLAAMANPMSMDPMASPMAMSSMPPMDMSSMPPMAMSSMLPMAADTMVSTQTMSASMSQMTYGSGSSSWGESSGYNSCVQQCAASNPMPSMVWTPSSTVSSGSMGDSVGNGVTHTVIVAPTKGVLRYTPFSTNASVGDTVSFVWGAGPHTVTQSSALEVCNKTLAPDAFASGPQNQSFVFNQVVNDTKPIWFYCGIPTHCEKGMFGGINIGQPDPTGSSPYMPLSAVMANLTTMSPQMSAAWSYTKSQTGNNAYANNWGMSTNCAGMSSDAMMQVAANAMYMQTVIASNPSMNSGPFTPSPNMTIPMDMISQILASTGSNSTTASSASAAASSVMPAAASGTSKSNGAGSFSSPSVVVGLVAITATFFIL